MAEILLKRLIPLESEPSGTTNLTGKYQETISIGDPVYSIEEPATSVPLDWDDGIVKNTTTVTSAPTSGCLCAEYSEDGVYLAVGMNLTPNLVIYKKTGNSLNKLTISAPSTYVTGVS